MNAPPQVLPHARRHPLLSSVFLPFSRIGARLRHSAATLICGHLRHTNIVCGGLSLRIATFVSWFSRSAV